MQTFLNDLRHALRQHRRNTAFSITAVLTISLGIGVNAALFFVGAELLFRARPGVLDASAHRWITPFHAAGCAANVNPIDAMRQDS